MSYAERCPARMTVFFYPLTLTGRTPLDLARPAVEEMAVCAGGGWASMDKSDASCRHVMGGRTRPCVQAAALHERKHRDR